MPDRSDTRARLLAAAVEVIDTRGEAALRVSEIAAIVGVKEPSIYHFFANREQLVVAAHGARFRRSIMEAVGLFVDAVASATSSESFLAGARRVVDFAFSSDRAPTRAARISVLGNALARVDLLREVAEASYQSNRDLAGVLAAAQQKGWMRTDIDPLTLAVWLNGQALARFLLEFDADRYDGDEWNRIAVETVLSALVGPTP